ncbi:MAG: Rrf2 family transcriptional regulator [Microgenomates group bacterium]
MLKLSKKSDYGLLVISKLIGSEEFISLSKLVEHTKLPLRFLARISAILAHHGVLASREGRVGGYKIGKRFLQMTVFDFLSIFETDMVMTGCQCDGKTCKFESICKHKDPVRTKLHAVILKDLQQVKLSELFS